MNSDCSSNKACIKQRCVDPCLGSCGIGTQCTVVNHVPMCTCLQDYTGDPFSNCYPSPAPCKNTIYFFISTNTDSMMTMDQHYFNKLIFQYRHQKKIHVIHHLVDQMLYVMRVYALVCQIIKEILI